MNLVKIARVTVLAGLIVMIGQAGARAAGKNDYSDSFEIGLEGQYYQYRERLISPKLQGYGGGLDGTYTFNFSNYFLRANILADFYDLNYSSNGTGTEPKRYHRLQAEITAACSATPSRSAGASASRLISGLATGCCSMPMARISASTGASGYNRRSQYLYAPVGVGFAFDAGHWGFRTYGEYDQFIHGWQTSYLRDLGFDNNLTNNQTAGYGLRGSFMVTPPLNFHNFSFGPYVRYWNIHNSDVGTLYVSGVPVATGLEPGNNTLELGIETSLRF